MMWKALLVIIANVLVVHGADVTATCKIEANSGIAPIYGTILLSQPSGGEVTFKIDLKGFPVTVNPTDHGFHVHEKGDLGNKCNASGGHYNPFNKTHGAPADDERHVGDFGNIVVSPTGEVNFEYKDRLASLTGDYSIVNRALVVHETFDDLGKGNFSDSNSTGHAGKRYGCCIIKLDSTNASTKWNPFSIILYTVTAMIGVIAFHI